MSIWGHLGSLGSKGHFHLKCYNSSNLHSMTIRLIHVHQLLTLYLFDGVKYQSRVIWGHWGQKVIFTKQDITHPCYLIWPLDSYTCISLRVSTYVMGEMSIWGHLGSLGSKGHFHKKCCNSSVLHSMTIRHTCASAFDPLPILWGQISISGHLGSLGSKGHFH